MTNKPPLYWCLVLLVAGWTLVKQAKLGATVARLTQKGWSNPTETHSVPNSLKTTTPNEELTTNKVLSVGKNRTLTLIVHLGGGLGNHLGYLTKARLMQRFVEREIPGMVVKMVGQHQGRSAQWRQSQSDLRNCFPTFQNFEFEAGVWDASFEQVRQQQQTWLGKNVDLLTDISTTQQISFLKSLLERQKQDPDTPPPPQLEGSPRYSLPYLSSTEMQNTIDDDVADFREFLRFDAAACCKATAATNETVFHFRGFISELRRESTRRKGGLVLNYIELSPNDTVDFLFNREIDQVRQRPKQVAIISRFTRTARPYLQAFQSRGWEARILRGQTGMEDFCFAMSASTLVGLAKSTFAGWAGLLGNATLVRLYAVHIDMPAGYRSETTLPPVVHGKEVMVEVYGRKEIMTTEGLEQIQQPQET